MIDRHYLKSIASWQTSLCRTCIGWHLSFHDHYRDDLRRRLPALVSQDAYSSSPVMHLTGKLWNVGAAPANEQPANSPAEYWWIELNDIWSYWKHCRNPRSRSRILFLLLRQPNSSLKHSIGCTQRLPLLSSLGLFLELLESAELAAFNDDRCSFCNCAIRASAVVNTCENNRGSMTILPIPYPLTADGCNIDWACVSADCVAMTSSWFADEGKGNCIASEDK